MAVEITEEFVWQNIPRRPRDSHKGTFGSVLAVAGSAFYRGAALLAAEGALRTGASSRKMETTLGRFHVKVAILTIFKHTTTA